MFSSFEYSVKIVSNGDKENCLPFIQTPEQRKKKKFNYSRVFRDVTTNFEREKMRLF